MRRTAKIALVIGIAVLLFIVILFVAARPSPPAITVRHIKSVQSGDLVTSTFGITNHTTSSYSFYPVFVEVRNALVWNRCFDFGPHSIKVLSLGPHGSMTETFDLTNLPTGSPLRLRFCNNKALTGLEGLFMRLDLRFRQGNRQPSLNPFDKKTGVLAKPTEFVSEEFVEPEANQ